MTTTDFDGAKLKSLRNSKGIYQTALAKRAGISRTYLSEIESGKKSPSRPVIAAIIAALPGVGPEDLGLESQLVDGTWYP